MFSLCCATNLSALPRSVRLYPRVGGVLPWPLAEMRTTLSAGSGSYLATLAALFVCYLQGGENFPLAHATAAHGSGKAGQDVVALSRRYTPPDRASWFLRTLPRQEPHQPLRRIGELRLIRREDPLVGLAVWAGGRRRHNVTSGGLHVETRRHLDAGPHVVFRVLKVEVHATARSACHRRSRVAVFLQL